ncbi:Hypothetical Protein FCC1311_032662 [Hondaea fermentalgiana]|uniref:Uncharacterized protein n=1 Tax=Hondaea fermentalgiana TaxID=2315210 RepID=A0A2R5GEK0_9STRA|nr:Hypothetical Protein FCC1311_032662 [Hondaea fermentalgiana]|eukprot:GBG27043.1 Hypothetical Protein FCC1311_032662 [Hondaea fermentalgiana]
MRDAASEQLFQDWNEEEERRLQESELDEAGVEERAQLLDVKQHEDDDKWLEHVDAYAKRCLMEMASPLSPSPSRSSDLEKGSHASSNQPQQEKRSAVTLRKKPHARTSSSCLNLTLIQKVTIRNFITASIALMLPFFEVIQSLTYNTSLMIPILTLILMLRPAHMTAYGNEAHQILVLIVSWPCFFAWSLVIIAASPHNIIGYLILFSLGVFVGFLVATRNPSILMILLGPIITYSIIHMYVFQIYNFYDYEDPFKEALLALGGATFGIAAAFGLNWLCSLLIFPWSMIKDARQGLSNRYTSYATLLRRLRPVYDRIALHALDPSADASRTFVSEELIDAVADARNKEIQSIVVSQRCVSAAILETRFFFNGDGLTYVQRHHTTLNLTRNARSSAAEIANHREDFLGPPGAESALQKMLEQRDLFMRQDAVQEAAIEEQEDEDARQRLKLARERIPMLITKLNLLLELGAHRMATLAGLRPSDRSQDALRDKMLSYLKRELVAMDALGAELENLAVSWMELYLRAHAVKAFEGPSNATFLKRTRIISYVLVLLKLVREQKLIVAEFEKEKTPTLGAAKREWALTFPANDTVVPTLHPSSREEMYASFPTRIARWEHELLTLCGSNPWKISLKFAFGTVMMVLPAMTDPFYKIYSSIQAVNAVFAFQVVLFRSQTGLVVERVVHRLLGIIVGAIILGVAWELSCINGCLDPNRKWIIYGIEIFCLFFYLWFKAKWPLQGYMGYAAMRTLASMSTRFVSADDPGLVDVWEQAGFVIASSAVGAFGALLLSIVIWPTSGRFMLREAIATSFHDFMLLTESVLNDRYNEPSKIDTMTPQVSAFEHQIARRLYMDTVVMLRSMQLETMQRINFDAPSELYSLAVQCSQEIWQSLWKLNHLGGVHIYLKDAEGRRTRTMHPHTARVFFAANRWLTSCFASIASQLNAPRRDSAPVLRPLVATPKLLNEMLDDFVGRAYRDETFLEHVVSSRDLALMLNLPLLADCLHDISISLDKLYGFMETYLRTPVYAESLRDAEGVSLDLYVSPKTQ